MHYKVLQLMGQWTTYQQYKLFHMSHLRIYGSIPDGYDINNNNTFANVIAKVSREPTINSKRCEFCIHLTLSVYIDIHIEIYT